MFLVFNHFQACSFSEQVKWVVCILGSKSVTYSFNCSSVRQNFFRHFQYFFRQNFFGWLLENSRIHIVWFIEVASMEGGGQGSNRRPWKQLCGLLWGSSCESVVFLSCALLIPGKTKHPLLEEGVVTKQRLHFRVGLIALVSWALKYQKLHLISLVFFRQYVMTCQQSFQYLTFLWLDMNLLYLSFCN